MKVIVAAIVVLVILLGYIFKPRIRRKQLKPHIVFDNNSAECKYRIKRSFLPYVAEMAVINNNNPAMGFNVPNLVITATSESKKGFKIVNCEDILQSPIMVRDLTHDIKDLDRLSRFTFAYKGFTMAPVPESDQRVGKFYMN